MLRVLLGLKEALLSGEFIIQTTTHHGCKGRIKHTSGVVGRHQVKTRGVYSKEVNICGERRSLLFN
jgi:hypothetical protein